MDKQARYITTTLPYVNASPHIGFALEIVQADMLARYWRACGHDVFFSTGTDEHGQKIAQKADEVGQEVQAYVDHFAQEFKDLIEPLNLSTDAFIRTTADAHKEAAQEMWRRCEANGDIYKKSYKGLYCVGDEMFLRDADLVDGRCPNHPNMEPQEIEEENYFFALSKYEDKLLAYLNDPGVVIPDWRREEAIAFIKNGLEDLSISRDKSRLSWGVPVPGDDTQVMYVWFDALTNYVSTTGWPHNKADFDRRWTHAHTVQVAGKDQIRFQSIIWQAMLLSAGLAPTDAIFYHGFITSGGQKMSKSLGNVIGPTELVERYGTEATRYMLLRHVHPVDDSDVTWDKLDEWYTAHLVNGLGNQVARVMKLAEDNLDAPVALPDDVETLSEDYTQHLDAFAFDDALNLVWEHIGKGDEFMQEHEPYKLVKSEHADDVARGKEQIAQMVIHIARIATYIAPAMPDTAARIREAVRTNTKPENLFPRLS